MIKSLTFTISLLFTLILSPLAAASSTLSPAKLALITQAQDYFDQIKTMQARFQQFDSNGGQASGELYLQKPGRLRMAYDPPSPLLLVADGVWLVVFDKEINQIDRIALSSTPLSLLLNAKMSFTGLTIIDVIPDSQAFSIIVKDKDNSDMGILALEFTQNPLRFHKWTIIDQQGIETAVTLEDMQNNNKFSPKLFVAPEPKRKKTLNHY